MAIRGAELSGIKPSELAVHLSRLGLHRIAEIARDHDRNTKADRGEADQRADEADESQAPDERGEVDAPAASCGMKMRKTAPAGQRPGAVRRHRIELITSEDYANRITSKAGIVLCLVDRNPPNRNCSRGCRCPSASAMTEL